MAAITKGGKANAMIRIGESDFLRAFDAMSEMARKDPLTITKQGRDSLVVMSAEEYSRLRGADTQAAPAGRGELNAATAMRPAH
jgi:prevent-host-death family protein